ncbi:MAG: 3'-5' exonuclease [Candidatus Shikimatogenerans sp. JK-2022]|nr:3'-5' exonuclease [Candidatus Shikimatogenerans bostrichidophilus]
MLLNNLSRPLCFIDIESTGLNILKDKIIELYILKIFPNKKKLKKNWLINPGIPIENTLIHGITNEKIKDKPFFKDIAKKILKIISNSDLIGFNLNRFDIPLLAEEITRTGLNFNFKKHKYIDIQTIYHKMVPRTLSSAYKFYCKKKLKAHKAKNDVKATYEIFKSQLKKYKKLKKKNIKELNEFTTYKKTLDPSGLILLDNKKNAIFNFGKYKGKKIKKIFKIYPEYYYFLEKANIPLYSKKILKNLKFKN